MATFISPVLVGLKMNEIENSNETNNSPKEIPVENSKMGDSLVVEEAECKPQDKKGTLEGEQKPTTSLTIAPNCERLDLDRIAAGITNDGLQRKRLSGAQKRKIRREEKMKSGSWTSQKPHTNRDERTHEIEFLQPVSNCLDPYRAYQSAKRPRNEEQTESYNEIAKSIGMAVIDERYPDILMTQNQADLIQAKILTELDQTLSEGMTPPQFEGSKYSGGILWMTCANVNTKEWLQTIIVKLSNLWEGTRLTVVGSKDLPKRPKVLAWIPGEATVDVVKTRLGLQNPTLITKDWRLLSRKVEDGEQILAFSIDSVSYKSLQQSRFKAYYGLRMVTFKQIQNAHEYERSPSSHIYRR